MPVRLWHFTWPEHVESILANGLQDGTQGFVFFAPPGDTYWELGGKVLLEVSIDVLSVLGMFVQVRANSDQARGSRLWHESGAQLGLWLAAAESAWCRAFRPGQETPRAAGRSLVMLPTPTLCRCAPWSRTASTVVALPFPGCAAHLGYPSVFPAGHCNTPWPYAPWPPHLAFLASPPRSAFATPMSSAAPALRSAHRTAQTTALSPGGCPSTSGSPEPSSNHCDTTVPTPVNSTAASDYWSPEHASPIAAVVPQWLPLPDAPP